MVYKRLKDRIGATIGDGPREGETVREHALD